MQRPSLVCRAGKDVCVLLVNGEFVSFWYMQEISLGILDPKMECCTSGASWKSDTVDEGRWRAGREVAENVRVCTCASGLSQILCLQDGMLRPECMLEV